MPGRYQKGRLSALDTETINGYAVILATEYRSWEAHSFEKCIQPIFIDIKHQKISGRLVLWNQKYDSQAILKYLPDDNINELIDCNETVYNDRYSIIYIPGKFIRIRDHKLNATISGYDIAQFYNYMHLDDAGEKYVNERKYSSEITNEITSRAEYHTSNELYWIFAHNLDEIKHYCMQDAKLTQKLGIYMADTIKEMYGFNLSSFASKTVIGKELTKKQVGFCNYGKSGKKIRAYPNFFEDSRAGKMATNSYHGGIFDCMKRGTFDKVTDIDISSAYPYHMKDLPNWSNGDFVRINDVSEIEKEDVYGWVFCEFDYPLIPYTSNTHFMWTETHSEVDENIYAQGMRKYYPSGVRIQCITLTEYKFLKNHNYLIDCYYGFVWRHNPKKTQYPPPFSWINDVYLQKQEIKKSLGKNAYQYSLTKIPMNSAYGSTAQKVGAAEFRNMFYASYITGNTRIQICEMLEDVGYDKYISIATDGILLDGNVSLPKRFEGNGLGSWDVDHWDTALILANGIYYYTRDHAIPEKRVKQALRGMLSFTGDLKQIIESNRCLSEFAPTTKKRPITMFQAMRWERYSKSNMNVFVDTSRKLSCNTDTSKKWDDISCFGDLLDGDFSGSRFTVEEILDFDKQNNERFSEYCADMISIRNKKSPSPKPIFERKKFDTAKKCRVCGIKLVAPDNCAQSRIKNSIYLCDSCRRTTRKPNQ